MGGLVGESAEEKELRGLERERKSKREKAERGIDFLRLSRVCN